MSALNLSPEVAGQPSGLVLLPDFVSAEEEALLLAYIDAEIWRNDLKRRVQHYGWVYMYKARRLDSSMHLGPLPPWIDWVVARMASKGLMPRVDQAIVNEYLPGQGIARHVDITTGFGPTILSLSLGWPVPMKFTRLSDRAVAELDLPPRSLLVLSDQARYAWAHEIPARLSDWRDGRRQARERRVSVTFRSVNIQTELANQRVFQGAGHV